MSASGPTDLVQDVLTDCSVVASLCATTSRSERGLGQVCIHVSLEYQFEANTANLACIVHDVPVQ